MPLKTQLPQPALRVHKYTRSIHINCPRIHASLAKTFSKSFRKKRDKNISAKAAATKNHFQCKLRVAKL